jgi:hypothetical protein
MAVEAQFVGQLVHCPHCQQAVQTVAPDKPLGVLTPPEATCTSSLAEDPDSIFHSPEAVQDPRFDKSTPTCVAAPPTTLFDSSVSLGPEEAPASTAVTTPIQAGELLATDLPGVAKGSGELSSAGPSAVTPFSSELPGTASASTTAYEVHTGLGSVELAADTPVWEKLKPEISSGVDLQAFATQAVRRSSPSGMRSGLVIGLVIIPLVSYSILATVAVLILYFRAPQPTLDYLPDIDGDLRGAKHQKQGPISYQRLDPDTPMPSRLRVGLGQTLRLGQVAVTPEKVELRPISFQGPDGESGPTEEPALVLHFLVQNTSADVVFCPTDPYFERQWKSGQDSKPYTFLEIGDRHYYGGPLPWHPGRERWIAGQTYRNLQPGEQFHTLVCTDPADHVSEALAQTSGELLYRIQIRRGLVAVGEREVSATAVVGVVFQQKDIQRPNM